LILRLKHWPRNTPISISTISTSWRVWSCNLQTTQKSLGFSRRDDLIESACRMGRQVILYNADVLGIGIMNIDELAHTLCMVFRRAPRGDLDCAPRPMNVEDDEEIDGAVTAVLVVAAFKLAWLSRDRLAHFANQLDRAFVETDHRSLRIRRFGIEVEHIFHAGDILPSTFGMHHISRRHGSWRHGLRSFSVSRLRTVSCDRLLCSVNLTMALGGWPGLRRRRSAARRI
jgi:hypothetical protein